MLLKIGSFCLWYMSQTSMLPSALVVKNTPTNQDRNVRSSEAETTKSGAGYEPGREGLQQPPVRYVLSYLVVMIGVLVSSCHT